MTALGHGPGDRLPVGLLAGAKEVNRIAVSEFEAVGVEGQVTSERERRGRALRRADDPLLDRDLAGGRRRLHVEAARLAMPVPSVKFHPVTASEHRWPDSR